MENSYKTFPSTLHTFQYIRWLRVWALEPDCLGWTPALSLPKYNVGANPYTF